MKREFSPLERSRQILREIELEQRRNTAVDKKDSSPSLQQDPAYAEEGTTMEGPPVKSSPSAVSSDESAVNPFLKFDQQSIVQGFIFSEVLGKPASRRRGRW